ncbi:MAG: hypothetical protein NZ918_01765, partial [Aigarchaeota archaeon]|nr:hypothetical protein [Aigarchaeota archaeon]
IAPLRVDAIHKNLTLIVRGSEGKVTIPYIISLETFPEPLKEINVIIELGGKKIDLKPIPKLYPGEMYLGNFDFTIKGNAPEKITYTIRIENAKGMLSERTYLGSKEADYGIQDYEDGGEIDVCVIEKVQVRVIEGDKEIPKDISYVRCDSQEEPPP